MPQAAPKPCTRCGVLVRDGTARCAAHKVVEASFADKRRGTRQQRGYGAAWDRLRLVVLARDHGLCQVCHAAGRIVVAQAVDHIMGKAAGGSDDLANLRAICAPCHRVKTQSEAAAHRARGGPSMSGPAPTRTDWSARKLRAQDRGVGGGDLGVGGT